MRYLLFLLLLLLGSCSEDSPINTEERNFTGTISGIVMDTSNNVLSGIDVSTSNNGHDDVTDPNGEFTLPDMPAGTYTIYFTGANYYDTSIANVSIASAEQVVNKIIKMVPKPTSSLVDSFRVILPYSGNGSTVSNIYFRLNGSEENHPLEWITSETMFTAMVPLDVASFPMNVEVYVENRQGRIAGYTSQQFDLILGNSITLESFNFSNALPTVSVDSIKGAIANEAIEITATAFDTVNNGSILKYQWVIDGTTIITDTNAVEFTFDSTGFKQLFLTVTDNDSNTAVASMQLYVTPGVLYVDKDARGTGDGYSWENAMTSIRSALQFASSNYVKEVWVADGHYQESYLELENRVAAYGGFDGSETSREERLNNSVHTIVSPRDYLVPAYSNNLTTVYSGAENGMVSGRIAIDTGSAFDGFIVTGFSNLTGAVQNKGTLRNCTIAGNSGIPLQNRGIVFNTTITDNTLRSLYSSSLNPCGADNKDGGIICNSTIVKNSIDDSYSSSYTTCVVSNANGLLLNTIIGDGPYTIIRDGDMVNCAIQMNKTTSNVNGTPGVQRFYSSDIDSLGNHGPLVPTMNFSSAVIVDKGIDSYQWNGKTITAPTSDANGIVRSGVDIGAIEQK